MPSGRVTILLSSLFLMLLFFQYRFWCQQGGMNDFFALKKKVFQQQVDNLKIKNMNEALLIQIKRLQNNVETAESRARSELGMIKKDETYYQIVK